jgi:uncharacterized repeat protein (TIGR01451 family)
MKGIKNIFSMTKLMVAIIALSSLAVFAANNETVSRALNIARPDVKVQISGSVQREDKTISLDKAEAVKPGEVLDWNISSANEGAGDAQNYGVVGQIPKGTSFVAGTAKGEESPKVTYSIDGGKTFSAQPMIDEKQPDGTVKKVAAPVSMYTQVMFEWANPLVSKANLNAAYRVRVK